MQFVEDFWFCKCRKPADKKALAIKPKICYIIDTNKKQPPTRG